MQKKSLWSFGTREVVFAAIGAALVRRALGFDQCSCRSQAPAMFRFARPSRSSFFFGLAFGPIVGFITGFLGNIIGDLLSGYGFWPWWDLGNGLMGLVAGLFWPVMSNYRASQGPGLAEIAVILGAAVGMFVASLTEIWVSGIDFATTMVQNFTPSFLTNVVNGLILTPILMIAYSGDPGPLGR